MPSQEEQLAQASFLLSFVVEIENFNTEASRYVVYYYNLKSLLKDNEKRNLDEYDKETEDILKANYKDELNMLIGMLNNLRILATRIYTKYKVLKSMKYQQFDEIEKEYKDLFGKEIIKSDTVLNFMEKLNKAYFQISSEIEKIRQRLRNI